MKILLLSDYATLTGGAEIAVAGLRDGLRQRGHDARWLASSARPLGAASHADYECLGSLSQSRILLQTANPWAYWKLRQVLWEFQPDVVDVNLFLTQLSPLILPLLRNIPALYRAHWYRAVCPTGTKMLPCGNSCQSQAGSNCYHNGCLSRLDWVLLMVQLKLFRRWQSVFQTIIPISQMIREELYRGGIKAQEPVRLGVLKTSSLPVWSPIPTIGFAGRLVPEKGADVLILAFARVQQTLPQARLILIGDGPERRHLEELTATLGLSAAVEFHGHQLQPATSQRLAQTWIQVVPSRWPEPLGLVAMEAMMEGRAVVASRCGGLLEIVVGGETGLLVPPDNPEALADALLQLLTQPSLAQHFGSQGRKKALQEFTEQGYIERSLRLYEQLTGLSPRLHH
ncbi:MAG TPA: glycosyltransferase family 4 protein [Acidobacteriota bacterium]|nr:glycosyltransferase family 4 protein [Acidobacteriota bacterium]